MSKITNRFVHFKTKASFTSRLGAGDIQESSVVFIQDANEIWAHGTYYKCDISEAEVIALINSKGYITEADIPSLTGGAAATSGQYVSGVTVSGHNVTVTKAALPTSVSGNAGTATKLATSRVIAIAGAVQGSATFDGSSNVSINSTLNGFDASKITSGTINADRLPEIPISKIPAAAMERLYVVESQSAAMSLTIQEGDVVQIGSGGPMYFCVSESASTFATKFKEFTAGSATSVPWSGVTGKPTFATVATSGSYNDLTNKPTIPSLSGYATQNWVTSQGYLTSIPTATASVLGGVKIGSNISVSSGTISLTSANVTSALGFTPAKTSDIPEIPIALPNPYALTINGTSYTGSSAVSITTPKPLITTTSFTGTQLLTTINAGYSYSNTLTRTVTSLNGFSESNPDAVIISTNKIFFNASNAIKMDGLGDLADGTYYIYCLSYMANGKVAVNGAVYT